MVKNENELLGELIKIQRKHGKVDNSNLSELTGTDGITLEFLSKKLDEKHYIVYSMDTSVVTDLGVANYVSKPKSFLLWIAKLLVLTLKEDVVFFSGVSSGLLVAYLMWKFGLV